MIAAMAYKEFKLEKVGAVIVYKRRGSRNIRLTLASDGKVKVTIPAWASYRSGINFAVSRQNWIVQNRPTAEQPLAEGQSIGKAHRLHFVADMTVDNTTTRIRGNQLIITYPAYLTPDDDAVQLAAQKAALRALRQEASKLLKMRLDELALKHGYDYRSFAVKRLKGRWGSCDQDKNIVFNIYLMQAPWDLIDYVIMHELAHTRVLRHGPPFWDEMERHLPDARHLRKRMKQYQPILKSSETV
jgi:predicted metal-dependent hydrolase